MTYLGIVFSFVFGGNVLFQYGAGSCVSCEFQEVRKGSAGFLVIGCISMLASAVHAVLVRFVLAPAGLDSLEPFAYVLLVAALIYGLATVLASSAQPFFSRVGRIAKKQVLSCVVYAAALAAARGNFKFSEAAAAGFAAAAGWWCAAVLLDKVMERLELEDVPPALAGVPLRFISAGLMAMAFSGVDKMLVSRMIG